MAEEEKKEIAGKSDEIDLIEVFLKIWERRNFIFKSMALFFALGLVIVVLSPKEYKSEVTLLVESSSSASGMSGLLQQFGGMAGLSGLDISTNKEALTPELYPDITKSTPFLLEILNMKLTDSRFDSTLMVFEHLDRHSRKGLGQLLIEYTIGLPGKVIRLFSGRRKGYNVSEYIPMASTVNTPMKLTPKQSRLASELSRRIQADEGKSSRTLIISAEMQDPRLAAELADSLVKNLTLYIIDYRTQKAKTDLKFIEQSHQVAESKYRQAQRALAVFKDRNMNIITASGLINEQNLQSEYTLTFNIYNTLSQQLEQAKLRVQEKTPVFKVMEPAKIPLSKSKPRTSLILFAMVFLGGFIGVITILGKLIVQKLTLS